MARLASVCIPNHSSSLEEGNRADVPSPPSKYDSSCCNHLRSYPCHQCLWWRGGGGGGGNDNSVSTTNTSTTSVRAEEFLYLQPHNYTDENGHGQRPDHAGSFGFSDAGGDVSSMTLSIYDSSGNSLGSETGQISGVAGYVAGTVKFPIDTDGRQLCLHA